MNHMCDLCFVDGVELGEVSSGHVLIHWQDQFHLLGGNGHDGDILFTFSSEPIADPDPEGENESTPEQEAAVDRFLEAFQKFEKEFWLSPSEGHNLFCACQQAGFSEEKDNLEYWVFHRCGLLVEQWKTDLTSAEKGATMKPSEEEIDKLVDQIIDGIPWPVEQNHASDAQAAQGISDSEGSATELPKEQGE